MRSRTGRRAAWRSREGRTKASQGRSLAEEFASIEFKFRERRHCDPLPASGPLVLLVLDADAVARCLVCDALRAEGFKVAEASTLDDAGAVMGSMKVDLVLADLDQCGAAFGDWLRTRHPGARLLFSSSKSGPAAAEAQVRKPYAVGEVVTQVMRSLHDPSHR